jgi:hypothetical protein
MITIMITIASDHHGRAERTMRGLLSRTRTRSLLGIAAPIRYVRFCFRLAPVMSCQWLGCARSRSGWQPAMKEGRAGWL